MERFLASGGQTVAGEQRLGELAGQLGQPIDPDTEPTEGRVLRS